MTNHLDNFFSPDRLRNKWQLDSEKEQPKGGPRPAHVQTQPSQDWQRCMDTFKKEFVVDDTCESLIEDITEQLKLLEQGIETEDDLKAEILEKTRLLEQMAEIQLLNLRG